MNIHARLPGVAIGVLVDAAGDDEYRAHDVAQGSATANGFGLLADAGRAWPTLPAAQAGVRSSCYRLQAAAAAARARLGAPLPADAVLPSFLQRIAPPEDTY